MALFGPTAVPSHKHLLEIKAGQMLIKKNQATPNTDKGLIYLQTGADQLVHFYWQNRETKDTPQDFSIIPGDAVFKNINACKTGRVYALYIPSSKSKHLYWLQEPDKEKDKELVEKMNQILSNPAPPPEPERGAHNMMDVLSSIRSSDMLEGMDPNLIEQLLQSSGQGGNPLRQFMNMQEPLSRGGGAGPPVRNLFSSGGDNTPSNPPGTNASIGTTDSESTGSMSGLDIQSLVSGIHLPQSVIDQNTPALFTEVLTPQALEGVLSDNDAVSQLESLLPDSPEPLKELFSSPQFAQAISFFSQGFLSRQLAPLMNEYGSEAVTAAENADLVTLARAIEMNLSVEEGIIDDDVIDGNGDGDGDGNGDDGEGGVVGEQDLVDDSDELD